MSVIGTFKANGNEYTGDIATLTIRAMGIRIVPAKRTTESGPSHRVFSGSVEIGAAWSKRLREDRPYLSVRLDDPSLMAPINATLLASQDREGHELLWSRGSARRDRE